MRTRSDRRRFPRTPSQFPLRYRLIPAFGAEYLDGRAEDLSVDGVRFSCPEAMRARTGLLFEMLIPGGRPVHAFARVAWVRELPGEDRFEVGSRFVDQSTVARKALERHLEREPGTVGP